MFALRVAAYYSINVLILTFRDWYKELTLEPCKAVIPWVNSTSLDRARVQTHAGQGFIRRAGQSKSTLESICSDLLQINYAPRRRILADSAGSRKSHVYVYHGANKLSISSESDGVRTTFGVGDVSSGIGDSDRTRDDATHLRISGVHLVIGRTLQKHMYSLN